MNRKEAAQSFLKTVVARRIREAYDRFIAPDFIHHNLHFKGDRESLLLAMEEAHAQFPDTTIQIQSVMEDGDKVMTHSLVKHRPSDAGFTAVHIFRFEGDRVAELWDLAMEIPAESPNEHGAF